MRLVTMPASRSGPPAIPRGARAIVRGLSGVTQLPTPGRQPKPHGTAGRVLVVRTGGVRCRELEGFLTPSAATLLFGWILVGAIGIEPTTPTVSSRPAALDSCDFIQLRVTGEPENPVHAPFSRRTPSIRPVHRNAAPGALRRVIRAPPVVTAVISLSARSILACCR